MFSSPQTKSDATKKTMLCENTGKMTTWDVVDFNTQKFISLFNFQKLFRGYRTRCLVYQISRETKAAIIIQAIWRRSLQSMVLTLTRKAVVRIQATVRGVQSRKIFAQKRDNVIKIQRFLKTRLAGKYRRAFIRDVVTCQVSFVL